MVTSYAKITARRGHGLPPALNGHAGLTSPSDVSDLRSWWDAYDSATYNGSNLLTGITDKGPDGRDMTPDTVAMPQTTYLVSGIPTALPGPSTGSFPTDIPEVSFTETITNFSVMLVIPANNGHLTQRCYYAIQKAGGYDLQVAMSGTTGIVDIKSATATDASIDCGLGGTSVDGSHAILFIRRSGTTLTVDSWYDRNIGAGVVNPAQVVATTTIPTSISATGMALGGV